MRPPTTVIPYESPTTLRPIPTLPQPVIEITVQSAHLGHPEPAAEVYTVPMSRKCAILLLAVVALWAATPAFACLSLRSSHRCCRQMPADCGMALMGAHSPCCTLNPLPASSNPETATGPVTQNSMAVVAAAGLTAPLPAAEVPLSQTAFTPPPRPLSGASQILRI